MKEDKLAEMYAAIYGEENLVHVPLRYEEFHEIKIFEKTYISSKSRSTRSSSILAVWPTPSGILTSRTPSSEDIRIGSIQYFLLHTPIVTECYNQESNTTTEVAHILAEIEWSQDHPQKFHLGNGVIIGAPISELFSSASFMPVSRIITYCAVVDKKIQMDYSLRIAIPMKQHGILTI